VGSRQGPIRLLVVLFRHLANHDCWWFIQIQLALDQPRLWLRRSHQSASQDTNVALRCLVLYAYGVSTVSDLRSATEPHSLIIHKTNNTLYAMVGYTLINATGTIVLCTVAPSESTRIGLFIAFILMQSFSAINTAMFLMMSRNIAGQTKKSLVYGSTFMAWGAGNAIAPQLFWSSWGPRYLPSLYMHLGIYAIFAALCLATRVLLVRRNKARDVAQQHLDGQSRNLHVSWSPLFDTLRGPCLSSRLSRI